MVLAWSAQVDASTQDSRGEDHSQQKARTSSLAQPPDIDSNNDVRNVLRVPQAPDN